MRSPLFIALAVVLAAAAAPPRARALGGFEGAVERGSSEIGAALAARKAERAKAAAKAAIKAKAETDPCAENPQLDKAAFVVSLETKLELTLRFKSCTPYYVDEAPHGRLDFSQAIRRYEDGRTDYALVVITPSDGAGKSQLVLVKGVSSAANATAATSALAEAKTIDLGGKAKLTPLSSPAAPPADDIPNGRDCR